MVKKFILVLFVLFFSTSICFAQHEYVYFTNDIIKVAWDAVYNAIGYNWEVRRLNDTTAFIQGTGNLNTISFKISSAGTYVLYCNAWNYKEDNVTKQVSDWATSLNAGTVNGVAEQWVIVVKLRKVGPLNFSDR